MKIKNILFEKVQCPNCHKNYDICLITCPYCHTTNEKRPERIIKSNISWFSPTIQITYFLIGFIGLFLVSTIVSILSYSLINNEPLYFLITNTVSYSVIFIAMMLVCLLSKTHFLSYFKNYKSYLFGLLGFVVLISLSFLISIIFSSFMKIDPGENQKIIEILVKNYPAFGFVILAFIGPIVEEFTYRIGLFSFLLRVNKILAYIVSIIVFTLIHLDFTSKNIINELISIPDYVLGASILALTYDLKGPTASITTHILNNLFSVIYILVTK